VAWVQVLLYVGAVVVLLLFAVMLTRAPIGMSMGMDRPRFTGALIGGGAGLGLAVLLVTAYRWTFVAHPPVASAADVGTAVFRTWGLPFEVVSVLLLAALIGAVVLARKDEPERGGPGQRTGRTTSGAPRTSEPTVPSARGPEGG